MDEKKEKCFNPMDYEVLLELATRICGRYTAWQDAAPSAAAGVHWRNASIELRRQVWSVDPDNTQEIEAKRSELRSIWAAMPVEPPVFAV